MSTLPDALIQTHPRQNLGDIDATCNATTVMIPGTRHWAANIVRRYSEWGFITTT